MKGFNSFLSLLWSIGLEREFYTIIGFAQLTASMERCIGRDERIAERHTADVLVHPGTQIVYRRCTC